MISSDTMRRALWSALSTEVARSDRLRRRSAHRPLWAFVRDTFGMGSTAASELCRDLGFDPDTGDVIRERGWEEPTC